ncbi:aspartyl-phosphate phosphatase Spo0E family protein [Paenibacillus sp.]|uniref:aspartyl-phosphate phosphatase Spo0E family protein n=1 Tax=Paenibacillus sp. TaxID=58172 RepID=UPI002D363472|nr:aspartyl-phosphate phosphatase Spo0E family protein [Paenibacillus sp.]HZG85541.1 aspartyl-phosphate phosphatase Spo0E family protein [Paenibacillus sp.]
MRNLQTVKAEIEEKRQVLINIGIRLGLTHPKTLQLSQEVDELHNELNRIVQGPRFD